MKFEEAEIYGIRFKHELLNLVFKIKSLPLSFLIKNLDFNLSIQKSQLYGRKVFSLAGWDQQ